MKEISQIPNKNILSFLLWQTLCMPLPFLFGHTVFFYSWQVLYRYISKYSTSTIQMPWLNVFYSFLACCCWNVWCDKKAINSNPQVTWYLDLELNGIQNNVLSCASSQVSVLLTPVVRWIHYTLWTCWCNKEKDYLIFKSYFQDNKKLEFQNILCRFLPYSYATYVKRFIFFLDVKFVALTWL